MVRLGDDGLGEVWASAVLRISGTQATQEEPQETSVLGRRGETSYMVGIIFLSFSTLLSCSNEKMMEVKRILSLGKE